MVKSQYLLSTLFSSSFMNRIIDNDHSSYLEHIISATNFYAKTKTKLSLQDLLCEAYGVLENSYRCEYIFKNVVLNELLLKKHTLKNTTYLTEVRTFTSKADIVMLNGTSSVYEIKSDHDNFNRLLNQVTNYCKVFDHVSVVSNTSNEKKLKAILPKKIGVITLLDNQKLSIARESVSNIRKLDKSMMFDTLRKPEYLKIISDVYGEVPNLPNTKINGKCRELFCKLTNTDAHLHFLSTLKERRMAQNQINLITRAKPPLKGILSDKHYSNVECNLINLALHQNITNSVLSVHQSKSMGLSSNC